MKIISVSSSKTEDKTPSDVLSIEELRKIAPNIPPDILFETISFAYWNEKFINSYGNDYLEEMRALDNNNQRYIVFCWVLGCHLWKWNESIFQHEICKPYCDFDKTDWDKADRVIAYLASFGY
jgi:hypothetical protein